MGQIMTPPRTSTPNPRPVHVAPLRKGFADVTRLRTLTEEPLWLIQEALRDRKGPYAWEEGGRRVRAAEARGQGPRRAGAWRLEKARKLLLPGASRMKTGLDFHPEGFRPTEHNALNSGC